MFKRNNNRKSKLDRALQSHDDSERLHAAQLKDELAAERQRAEAEAAREAKANAEWQSVMAAVAVYP